MPNRTLYVRDQDQPVWEQAEQIAKRSGVSFSLFVTMALRRVVPGHAKPRRGSPAAVIDQLVRETEQQLQRLRQIRDQLHHQEDEGETPK